MRRHDREITDAATILALIEAADSCRLGLVDDAGPVSLPYVVALNYGYEPHGADSLHGTFWFHGARSGYKLDLVRSNPNACLQLDGDHRPVKHGIGCGWGMTYASVVATGKVRLVDDPAERRQGLNCLMAHYLRLWGPPEGTSSKDADATLPDFDDSMLSATAVLRLDVEHLTAKRRA